MSCATIYKDVSRTISSNPLFCAQLLEKNILRHISLREKFVVRSIVKKVLVTMDNYLLGLV